MPKDYDLQTLYKLVAGNVNVEDFTLLLQRLADNATDVRIAIPNLGKDDSIIIRKAIYDYLKLSIDNIRRIKQNKSSAPSVVADGE